MLGCLLSHVSNLSQMPDVPSPPAAPTLSQGFGGETVVIAMLSGNSSRISVRRVAAWTKTRMFEVVGLWQARNSGVGDNGIEPRLRRWEDWSAPRCHRRCCHEIMRIFYALFDMKGHLVQFIIEYVSRIYRICQNSMGISNVVKANAEIIVTSIAPRIKQMEPSSLFQLCPSSSPPVVPLK
jgi:hypothetical protein